MMSVMTEFKTTGSTSRSRITCVIPTFNAAGVSPGTLQQLAGFTLMVADGGSSDETCGLAIKAGARVVVSLKGRGQQLKAGAEVALVEGAQWLLFLHADTKLDAAGLAEVTAFTRDPDNQNRAAVFRFAVDDNSPAARRLEGLVNWRSRVLALPYGDQGLLISGSLYQSLGGYRTLELMEDVDLVRRIGRRRLVLLNSVATTSATRFQQHGYLRRSARNLTCLALFFLGVPVRWIARLYG
jgi:glycosyltransferase involved in cell wall biosynthesis